MKGQHCADWIFQLNDLFLKVAHRKNKTKPPVGFQSVFEYWVSRQLFTWDFAALLQFQRGLGAIFFFYRILWREGVKST